MNLGRVLAARGTVFRLILRPFPASRMVRSAEEGVGPNSATPDPRHHPHETEEGDGAKRQKQLVQGHKDG